MNVLLLVEDHNGVAAISQRLLEGLGYKVVHARSGASAWLRMQKIIPHIVLLDLSLPDIHGYQLADMIRSDQRFDETLVVALTGFGLTGDAVQSKTHGIDAHFRKPMDFAELASVKRATCVGLSHAGSNA